MVFTKRIIKLLLENSGKDTMTAIYVTVSQYEQFIIPKNASLYHGNIEHVKFSWAVVEWRVGEREGDLVEEFWEGLPICLHSSSWQ